MKYEVIGANHVAVPTHFYKIVVGETQDSKFEMEAFVMPNAPIDDNTPLTNFQVPNFFYIISSYFIKNITSWLKI